MVLAASERWHYVSMCLNVLSVPSSLFSPTLTLLVPEVGLTREGRVLNITLRGLPLVKGHTYVVSLHNYQPFRTGALAEEGGIPAHPYGQLRDQYTEICKKGAAQGRISQYRQALLHDPDCLSCAVWERIGSTSAFFVPDVLRAAVGTSQTCRKRRPASGPRRSTWPRPRSRSWT